MRSHRATSHAKDKYYKAIEQHWASFVALT